MATTLYDKLWNAHEVSQDSDGLSVLYIDRQMLHDVSSPQAFAMLRDRQIDIHRPLTHIAVADHAVPTRDRTIPIANEATRNQVELLAQNARSTGVPYVDLNDSRHGIVHIMGPELGFTLPGMTMVCGDSHTSTHGAFGALAFGIGSSESACVLATQTLRMRRSKSMRVTVAGRMNPGVTAKDVILHLIGVLGAGGGTGYVIEYAGPVVRSMSMSERMTLCNMTIEAGSRAGLVAPDETTFEYLKGRAYAPKDQDWDTAVAWWSTLVSDVGARFDREITIDGLEIKPQVTWGTSPDQVMAIDSVVPDPATMGPVEAQKTARALEYMGIAAGSRITDLTIDHVFIGSCTNGRLEDLRAAAAVLRDRQIAPGVQMLVVPGSDAVKIQAEAEGLDQIFISAGSRWENAGCSLCVAMNGELVDPGQRCASTTNRNFEGRQGPGARTHLMSPAMAAASAVAGRICDPRNLES
ncbi:3-isopropylmalate dehydratase large subunit [Paraburkholderia phymatum]|uniref:3-isopropylmalate dehydratase large subunit n=1 Tax=Paraburkholderia phymatum TaxID=148447 RepID=UPI00316EC381